MIEILLSTYNGEKYLREQLDSLFAQTQQDWELLIRDDGSKDKTPSIIEDYIKRYPGRIFLLEDERGNLGSGGSFSALLEQSNAPYVMFCDQDDVWLPRKIEKTFSEMRDLESKYPDLPLLVATDLTIVDENLQEISPSFIQDQRLFPDALQNVYKCLALSVVPGCTMMLNRRAVLRSLPLPQGHGHDHWIASIVSYYGKISFCDFSTILYRQHGKNVYGKKKIGFLYYCGRFRKIFSVMKAHYTIWKQLPFSVNPIVYGYYIIYYAVRRCF